MKCVSPFSSQNVILWKRNKQTYKKNFWYIPACANGLSPFTGEFSMFSTGTGFWCDLNTSDKSMGNNKVMNFMQNKIKIQLT